MLPLADRQQFAFLQRSGRGVVLPAAWPSSRGTWDWEALVRHCLLGLSRAQATLSLLSGPARGQWWRWLTNFTAARLSGAHHCSGSEISAPTDSAGWELSWAEPQFSLPPPLPLHPQLQSRWAGPRSFYLAEPRTVVPETSACSWCWVASVLLWLLLSLSSSGGCATRVVDGSE